MKDGYWMDRLLITFRLSFFELFFNFLLLRQKSMISLSDIFRHPLPARGHQRSAVGPNGLRASCRAEEGSQLPPALSLNLLTWVAVFLSAWKSQTRIWLTARSCLTSNPWISAGILVSGGKQSSEQRDVWTSVTEELECPSIEGWSSFSLNNKNLSFLPASFPSCSKHLCLWNSLWFAVWGVLFYRILHHISKCWL